MKLLFALVFSLICTSLVMAQPPAPSGSAPSLKVIASVDKEKGEIVITTAVTKAVPVTVEKEVFVNGMVMKVTVTEYQFVVEMLSHAIKVSDSRVITTDGKQLPIEDVWKRLKKDSVIALSGDANAPAQAYLRALNAETLVLIPGPPTPIKK